MIIEIDKNEMISVCHQTKKNICQQCSMEIDRSLLFNKLSLSLSFYSSIDLLVEATIKTK